MEKVVACALATVAVLLGPSAVAVSTDTGVLPPAAAVSATTPSEGGVAASHGAAGAAGQVGTQWRELWCVLAPWHCR